MHGKGIRVPAFGGAATVVVVVAVDDVDDDDADDGITMVLIYFLFGI